LRGIDPTGEFKMFYVSLSVDGEGDTEGEVGPPT
jgi:hypothetical protein